MTFFQPPKYFESGFTLVEIIIAIFILTIGISAVLVMFPLGTQLLGSSKMTTIGIQLAQEKIEEVISTSYETISIGEVIESALLSPFDAYKREIKVSYVDPTFNLQEIASDKGIKKIEVTVSWKTSLEFTPKNIKLITLISRR